MYNSDVIQTPRPPASGPIPLARMQNYSAPTKRLHNRVHSKAYRINANDLANLLVAVVALWRISPLAVRRATATGKTEDRATVMTVIHMSTYLLLLDCFCFSFVCKTSSLHTCIYTFTIHTMYKSIHVYTHSIYTYVEAQEDRL